MNILIIAATKKEIEPLMAVMKSCEEGDLKDSIECVYKELLITIMITGVGMAPTAISTVRVLADYVTHLALNVGLCGSFNRNLEIGTVVNVYQDCFSELGAEDGDQFLSLEEMGLEGGKEIINVQNPISNIQLYSLPRVNGITVNTVHGNEKSIDKVINRFHPIVESMEGAAFMLACQDFGKPYFQIRAVSNYVEKRNKDNWNIPLAIENLNKKLIEILDAF